MRTNKQIKPAASKGGDPPNIITVQNRPPFYLAQNYIKFNQQKNVQNGDEDADAIAEVFKLGLVKRRQLQLSDETKETNRRLNRTFQEGDLQQAEDDKTPTQNTRSTRQVHPMPQSNRSLLSIGGEDPDFDEDDEYVEVDEEELNEFVEEDDDEECCDWEDEESDEEELEFDECFEEDEEEEETEDTSSNSSETERYLEIDETKSGKLKDVLNEFKKLGQRGKMNTLDKKIIAEYEKKPHRRQREDD